LSSKTQIFGEKKTKKKFFLKISTIVSKKSVNQVSKNSISILNSNFDNSVEEKDSVFFWKIGPGQIGVETPGACIIKLIRAVIYGFRNKLECLSLNTRLGWKGFPGTSL
jgi:hypothetical protein